ncbi:hypothetical protein GH714_041629 [Hevea brasiliensis]|uniref:DUF4283 domain-containing protein n=1 Tax=Hevea brasiliensis TaxID=3981 RepID=A0A6A6MV39_HEVBR|nr:hypothetical protein GH714_041629 [Hevea brasiliensis]
MKNTMASLWRPGRCITIKDIGSNLYLFQFFYVVDLNRVVDRGPWSFNNPLLIFHKLEHREMPTRVSLFFVAFWVQIHDLPIRYFSESAAKQLGNSVGRFLAYNTANTTVIWHNFMRLRVGGRRQIGSGERWLREDSGSPVAGSQGMINALSNFYSFNPASSSTGMNEGELPSSGRTQAHGDVIHGHVNINSDAGLNDGLIRAGH